MTDNSDLPRGFCAPNEDSTPIQLIETNKYEDWFESQSADNQEWLRRQQFSGKAGQSAWLEIDGISSVIACWDGQPVGDRVADCAVLSY